MQRITNVTKFVETNLTSAIAPAGWVCITNDDYIGELNKKFEVFTKTRSLSTLPLKGMNYFMQYNSLMKIRGNGKSTIIACDSEWFVPNNSHTETRFILSWQFAFVKDAKLTEVVFVAKTNERLFLDDALSIVYWIYEPQAYKKSLAISGIRKYKIIYKNAANVIASKTFTSLKELKDFSKTVTKTVSVKAFDDINPKKLIPITLLFHTALVDMTAFNHKNVFEVMRKLTSIQKGLNSLQDVKLIADLKNKKLKTHRRIFPFSVVVRDTLCQGPPDKRKLDDYGHAIGIPKVNIGDHIEKMDLLFQTDPCLYFDYAGRDSIITLLYSAALYGYGSTPNLTITSSASKIMYSNMYQYLGAKDPNHFDRIYRGLRSVNKGKLLVSSGISCSNDFRIPYIDKESLEPISPDVHQIQYMASLAYHGGYNICSEIGYFTNKTFDYDLKNAYPTSMYTIADLDWENPIAETFKNIDLSAFGDEHFKDDYPMHYFLAVIDSFEFPKDTPFPCIPVMVKGTPVYPLTYSATSEACQKVPSICITGPELYLAYKLGAKAKISLLHKLNLLQHTKVDEEGNIVTCISKSMADAVKQLVYDRSLTTKKTLENTILKVMVNSCYGKIAQNVIDKNTWDAEQDEMQPIGPSKITNPVSAAFITAIVRCTLIAAQSECVAKGYKIYSVTTDGFISDIPEKELLQLELKGFRDFLYAARLELTNNVSKDIWEIKHTQDELLNFTTRGNVSLDPNGVCAHNSARSGLPKDSYEDRKWLMTEVLSRTGKIKSLTPYWVSFKDFIKGKYDDFDVYYIERHLSMDFDMKRKPVKVSFNEVQPTIDGDTFNIACFSTVPYDDVGEYIIFKKLKENIVKETKKKRSYALRTNFDWNHRFWKPLHAKLNTVSKPTKLKNADTTTLKKNTKSKRKSSKEDPSIVKKLRNCLYAHYAGIIKLPFLEEGTARECASAINKANITMHTFNASDFKNFKKQSRWPAVFQCKDSFTINDFLQQQEPVMSQLLALEKNAA